MEVVLEIKEGICPHCEDVRDIICLKSKETTDVKGLPVTATTFYSKCSKCDKDFSTPDQLDKSLKNLYKEYERVYNKPVQRISTEALVKELDNIHIKVEERIRRFGMNSTRKAALSKILKIRRSIDDLKGILEDSL